MNIPLTTSLVALAAFATTPIQAQDTGMERETKRQDESRAMQKKDASSSHVALDRLIGATVKMHRSTGLPNEGVRRGERQGEPEMGGENRAVVDEGKEAGEVQDFLVRASSGDIGWAVVELNDEATGTEGKTVVVPMKALKLRWKTEDADEGERTAWFALLATQEELRAAPSFDMAKAKKQGLRQSLQASEASWKRSKGKWNDAHDASGQKSTPNENTGRDTHGQKKEGENSSDGMQRNTPDGVVDQVTIDETTFVRYRDEWLQASRLDGTDFYTRTESFGDVGKVLVDCDSGCVDFVVVSHGGVVGIGDSEYLVPFAAIVLRQQQKEQDEMICHVDKSKDTMTAAIRYEKPENGVVTQDAAKTARKHFGLSERKAGHGSSGMGSGRHPDDR